MEIKILVLDDDYAVRSSLELLLANAGYKVFCTEEPAAGLKILETEAIKLIVLDMNYSRDTSGEEGLQLLSMIRKLQPEIPVILITAWGSIQLAVAGMKLGAADFINKPWDNHHLLRSIKTALMLREPVSQSALSREALDRLYDLGELKGRDSRFLEVLETAGRIAKTDATVLIEGESGTGKELIAEAIHQNSNRKGQPFVKVNLGGIPPALFESEMFGHVQGAFTDAKHARKGRFEMANGGTIFLDEIGELDMSCQVKLLRVLQEFTFEVLGSNQTRRVDVRVISATNKDLAEMVEKGEFREDLYYRLNLIRLHLPSLRERRQDIRELIKNFLETIRQKYKWEILTITQDAVKWLQSQDFPGNIRELKNLLERVALVSGHTELGIEDFRQHRETARRNTGDELPPVGSMTMEQIEISMIKKALQHHHNNISKAAHSLGMSRAALYRRLDKYKIEYENKA
ncbi:MAG: sigma-54 dependent transcriptional regulator [Candidatus Cloacimonetes bacterium]|nr:sigma-54 dependent transcriptional regulator [Candidatus Cloacimonadota bacterium]